MCVCRRIQIISEPTSFIFRYYPTCYNPPQVCRLSNLGEKNRKNPTRKAKQNLYYPNYLNYSILVLTVIETKIFMLFAFPPSWYEKRVFPFSFSTLCLPDLTSWRLETEWLHWCKCTFLWSAFHCLFSVCTAFNLYSKLSQGTLNDCITWIKGYLWLSDPSSFNISRYYHGMMAGNL